MKVFVSRREQTSAGLQQREAPRASFKQALTGAERLGQCWSVLSGVSMRTVQSSLALCSSARLSMKLYDTCWWAWPETPWIHLFFN